MIDLKTCANLGGSNYRGLAASTTTGSTTATTSAMDNDWYYRWLLFSQFQHQGWQHKMLSSSPQDVPAPLVNMDSVCGFCETIGTNVKQSPDVTTRILQALNFSKPPLALDKPELNERIGLCNKCEHQIKLLEEAANIRENLTESLLSNLKHLSTSAEAHPTLNGYPLNGQSPHHFQFAQSLQQRNNEITPQQHSIKRKISGITNWAMEGPYNKNRQLKRHLMDRPLEQTPNGLAFTEPTNSSDEENALMINELSSSVSPHSSHGSFTPPPISPSTTQQNNTSTQQVLSEVTCGRKRRKQARPAKAAGDIVPAVLPAVIQHRAITSSVSNGVTFISRKSPSLAPFSPSPSPTEPNSVHSSRPSSASTSHTLTPATSPASQTPAAKRSKPIDPKLHTAQLAAAAQSLVSAAPFPPTLPFNYTSFYQNNISNLFSSPPTGSTAPAALLAQSIYKAASNNSLMSISSPLLLQHKNMQMPFANNKSSHAKIQPKTPGLLSAKKEPKLPNLSLHHHHLHVGRPANQGGAAGANSDSAQKIHKLVKTDKRRYCKVCAASMRKANNGRPPQSRFLCEPCNMPMCRSCIEEHRNKCAGIKGEVKPSASAQLLQAVKMKDKAAGDGSKPIPIVPAPKSLPSSILSAPPSHSSVIYGSPAPNMLTSAASTPITAPSDQRVFTSNMSSPPAQLNSQPSSTALDMRLPLYKPIAPAPAKPSTPEQAAEPVKVKTEKVVEEEDEEGEKPLVIAESSEETEVVKQETQLVEQETQLVEQETVVKQEPSGDQTAITPEMASNTVAMLMPMDDESSSVTAAVQATTTNISLINQSFQSIPKLPTTNGSTCAPVESSIPMQQRTPSVI